MRVSLTVTLRPPVGQHERMALFQRKTVGKPGEWFYCLKHQKVEEGPECPARDRFGPYASREEAAHAMQTAHERNLQWRHDPRWHDSDAPDAGGDPDAEGPAPGGRTPDDRG